LERQRLFAILEDLVKWENSTNETVLQAARDEIWASWRRTCAENADHPRAQELFDRHKLPAFHDPFAGGGALPLEAQRLGLESYASDLNPVAVLINKAMIEIPPKFAGRPAVNPQVREDKALFSREWKGAQGLAEDVRHYGQWMRDEAEKRIGALYPKVAVAAEMAKERPDLKPYVGQELTVIAWLWARTVKSPNPAFAQVDVPLASTFMLSTKAGKEAYVEPVIENGGYRFTVKVGKPKDAERAKSGTKLSRGANFECLMSKTPMAGDYIKAEGKAGRMGARLMAIVAEGTRGRVYLAPTPEHEAAARRAKPEWKPEVTISGSTQYLGVKPYGMDRFDQLFSDRQLVALTTFSDLVQEARARVQRDALQAGLPDDPKPLREGGTGSRAYGEAISLYLGFLIDQQANQLSKCCGWNNINQQMIVTFSMQALQMKWDFAECNVLSSSTGSFGNLLERQVKGIASLAPRKAKGSASIADACIIEILRPRVVATDPPYYDNVPYADLSDYFYVWLRQALKCTYPEVFATLSVPKAEELVAFAYRHGGKEEAEGFFLTGMTRAMRRLADQAHPAFPVTIFYAFRQAESDGAAGRSSTGWETFLDSVISAGFATSGTWPLKTESTNKLKAEKNALASSIVLVCRKRPATAPTATRREFVAALKAELPAALADLQRGNIAPVDLAQAAIGPGMAVYTRYAQVLDAQGKKLSVREALALINQTLDEALAEQEGDFDADSRWALTWFDQHGFDEGDYGTAEQLSVSKNTSVAGMVEAGIIESKRGKVRLYRPDELPSDWDPATDTRLTAWEVVHHLIRVVAAGGEGAAGALVFKLGAQAEVARELAYRLYSTCERKKRNSEALAYNGLVQSWPEIYRLSQARHIESPVQGNLFTSPEA
jgi:putative DNA methylase